MIDTEMKIQQLIGEQIIVVRIIHSENEKVARGGVSFVGVDDLSTWMECDSSDVIKLRDMTCRLDPFEMSVGAAKQYTQTLSTTEYAFFLNLYSGFGRIYIRMKLWGIPADITTWGETSAKRCRESNIKIDSVHTDDSLTAGLEFFFDYYMENVRLALHEYDAEVVREMLCINEKQFEPVKTYLGMK